MSRNNSRAMKRRRFRVVLATILLASMFLAPGILERRGQPVYEGRRVGEWFDDLCLGSLSVPIDSKVVERKTRASAAFTRMDSNAVPFLIKKLRTPDSAVQEKLIMRARKLAITKPVGERLIPPSHARLYAAHALGRMGVQGESALPALVTAFESESETNVAKTIRDSLLTITSTPLESSNATPENLSQSIRSRYPRLFRSGGSSVPGSGGPRE
jgi:hypothetical protein